jgi:hypothetical protein
MYFNKLPISNDDNNNNNNNEYQDEDDDYLSERARKRESE